MAKTARPLVIGPSQYEALRKAVQAHQQATLSELTLAWTEFTREGFQNLCAHRPM